MQHLLLLLTDMPVLSPPLSPFSPPPLAPLACGLDCCPLNSAGAGGDEAGIWAGDLLRMYQRYASGQGWKASMISCVEADAGGYKEVVLEVRQREGACGSSSNQQQQQPTAAAATNSSSDLLGLRPCAHWSRRAC